MEWISVKDKLPPDFQEVLYFAITNNGNTREIMTGHRENGFWKHCCMFYSSQTLNHLVKVTHWMELPNYPAEIQCTHENINMEPAYQCEDCKKYVGMS